MSGVNKFDASNLEVGIDCTLLGQGVNATSMGLASITPETAPRQVSTPRIEVSAPGVGGR